MSSNNNDMIFYNKNNWLFNTTEGENILNIAELFVKEMCNNEEYINKKEGVNEINMENN